MASNLLNSRSTAKEQQRLESELSAKGIDVGMPGFCESEAFVTAEAHEPSLLLKYGQYVRGRAFDDMYAERVRRRVHEVADYLTGELARDGRLGACLDLSAVALKFSNERASGDTKP